MGSGAVAQTLGPLRRDGDLIPFSMTLGLLPILARIVAYLILKTVLLLIVVVSGAVAQTLGPLRRDDDLIPFSMTLGQPRSRQVRFDTFRLKQ